MRSSKHFSLLVAIMFLFAACNQSPAPEATSTPEITVLNSVLCPRTGEGDPAWTKIEGGISLGVTGEFGEFSYGGTKLSYSINDGYTLEFCIKSGSKAGTDYYEVTGPTTSNISIDQDISHVSWRILVKNPPLKKLVDLTVEKTATASYERLVEWTLTKTVDGQESVSFTGKPGNQFSATWKVVATKTTDEFQNYSITGKIEIANPNPVAVDVSVIDELDDGTPVNLDCPSNTVAAEGSLVCTYEASPEGKAAKLNTVTVTVDQDSYTVPAGYTGKIEGGTATADVLWGDPILVGDPNPRLKDDRAIFDYEQNISDTTTLEKTETFTCPAYSADKYPGDTYSAKETNTATLTGNRLNLNAFATVNLTCKVTWKDETATGKGSPWSAVKGAPSTWFMYTAFTTSKIDLIAGQHYDAGDIYMTRNGTTSITITLHDGFRFANMTNNAKINPMGLPKSYIQPGQYSVKHTASGSSITVTGLSNTDYYAIHVDVLT